MTRVRHEGYTNNTSSTQVKNFDFNKDKCENIYSHPYMSYIANGKLQGVEQFHSEIDLASKICHLEMIRSHAKMRLKSAPQNLNFVMAKAI